MDPEDAYMAVKSGRRCVDCLQPRRVANSTAHPQRSTPCQPSWLRSVTRLRYGWDGGIRSGQDVFKAIALGAKGTLIGRAFLYGLGAMGEAGVTRCLQIIEKELDLTMAFSGLSDINDVDETGHLGTRSPLNHAIHDSPTQSKTPPSRGSLRPHWRPATAHLDVDTHY